MRRKVGLMCGQFDFFSYLSPLVKIGCISEIKTKNFLFCFVFRSICTTFDCCRKYFRSKKSK